MVNIGQIREWWLSGPRTSPDRHLLFLLCLSLSSLMGCSTPAPTTSDAARTCSRTLFRPARLMFAIRQQSTGGVYGYRHHFDPCDCDRDVGVRHHSLYVMA